jgi:hypothetical protein
MLTTIIVKSHVFQEIIARAKNHARSSSNDNWGKMIQYLCMYLCIYLFIYVWRQGLTM